MRLLIYGMIALGTCLQGAVSVMVNSEELGRSDASHVMRIAVQVSEDLSRDQQALWQEVARQLSLTGQLKAECTVGVLPTDKESICAKSEQGYPFVLYGEQGSGGAASGRLYDADACSMLIGKRWTPRPKKHAWAHAIAADCWEVMMGSRGSFTSRIAYVKRSGSGELGGRNRYQLCTAAWDGSDEQLVLERSKPIVAPVFYRGLRNSGPWLFFSEFTPANVRLCATSLHGPSTVILDRNGTTVGVDVSAASAVALYSHSGVIWKYTYQVDAGRGVHTQIIKDPSGVPCTHPILLDNDDVIYCSGGKIFQWSALTKQSTQLPIQGYVVAPSLHRASNILVAAKRVNGVMQIISYNLKTKRVQQLTKGRGDKVDPVISPCGTCVAYTREDNNTSEIWVQSILSNASWRISPSKTYCSYAAWSPVCA